MKVKPTEVLVNLPTYLIVEREEFAAEFAANVNHILHGKVKMKYEILGVDNENKLVALFYLNRNREYSEFREFLNQYFVNEQLTYEYEKNK